MMVRPSKKVFRHTRSRGVASVELAVVLPLIMLFFTFVFEFGRVMMLQHTADTAAYEAARSAMVPGATADEACQTAQQFVDASGLSNVSILVTPSVLTENTPLITVQVDIPVNDNSWIAPHQFGNFVVTSEVTLMCERPPIVRLSAMDDLAAKKAALQTSSGG